MPNFLFVFHGGKMPDTPEEGAREMEAWQQWYADMGQAVVDGGAPVGKSKTVTAQGVADDGGSNPASGMRSFQQTHLRQLWNWQRAAPFSNTAVSKLPAALICKRAGLRAQATPRDRSWIRVTTPTGLPFSITKAAEILLL